MILARPLVLEGESCALLDSVGRVLSQDFAAPEDLPRRTYSAMDGFAVRHRDVRRATAEAPALIRVVGESRPGRAIDLSDLSAGEAVAIATGGAIPEGADAIVPVEWTQEVSDDQMKVLRAPAKRAYFRRAGSDVTKGRVLLRKGCLIDAAAFATIAQFGVETIEVFRRPRVGILTSGDELVLPGRKASADQVVATNLYYCRLALESAGCEVKDFGVAPDRFDAVRDCLARSLDWSDLTITLAGVSAGKRDFVVSALESLGAEIVFHGVAVKPGKPTLFALAGGKPVIALPGNPLSSACGLEIFVKPYLRACFDVVPVLPKRMEAPLGKDVSRDQRRLSFLFSRLAWTSSGPVIQPPGRQESGNLSLLSEADCLAEIPPGDEPASAGTVVRLWPLR